MKSHNIGPGVMPRSDPRLLPRLPFPPELRDYLERVVSTTGVEPVTFIGLIASFTRKFDVSIDDIADCLGRYYDRWNRSE